MPAHAAAVTASRVSFPFLYHGPGTGSVYLELWDNHRSTQTTTAPHLHLQHTASNSTSSRHVVTFPSGAFPASLRHFLWVPWCYSRFTELHLCLRKESICSPRSLAHDVPLGDHLGNDGNAQRPTQLLGFLCRRSCNSTVSAPSAKWKWIVIKVFHHLFFPLGRRRRRPERRVGVAVSGWREEVGGRPERQEAGTLSVTLWKHMVISVWHIAFPFLQKPFYTVPILPPSAFPSVPTLHNKAKPVSTNQNPSPGWPGRGDLWLHCFSVCSVVVGLWLGSTPLHQVLVCEFPWCGAYLLLNFSKTHVSIPFALRLSFIPTIYFMIFLIGSWKS